MLYKMLVHNEIVRRLIYIIFIFTDSLRTLGSIRKNTQRYRTQNIISNGKLKSAKDYKSCFAEPLIDYEGDYLVIDLIPPMELHILLGIVNRLYDNLDKDLEKSGLSLSAKEWSDKLFIYRRHYHGGQFVGNHCF